MTDPKSNLFINDYDILNRLTRVVSHDGTATLYEYDANGNRTAVKYEGGITTTYKYDEVNRLIEQATIDKDKNIMARYIYTLGEAGERVKLEESDSDGPKRTVEYECDQLYRLVKETITDSSCTRTTKYSYDNQDRLIKAVVKDDGKTTTESYLYDYAGRRIAKNTDGKVVKYLVYTSTCMPMQTRLCILTRRGLIVILWQKPWKL